MFDNHLNTQNEIDFNSHWENHLNDPNEDDVILNLPDFEPGTPIGDEMIEAIAAFDPRFSDTVRIKSETDMNPFGLIASAVRGLVNWLGL